MKPLAKIKTIDIEGVISWEKENRELLRQLEWTDYGYHIQSSLLLDDEDRGSALTLKFEFFISETEELDMFRKVYDRVVSGKAGMPVYHISEDFIVVKYSAKKKIGVIIPKKFCELEMIKSDIDFLHSIEGKSSNLPISNNSSVPELISKVATGRQELEAKKELIDKTNKELAKKQEEIRKEMDLKMAELRRKADEELEKLKEMKEGFEKQLFFLEGEIDVLRSLLGDNYKLLHLRDGKRAQKDTPLVVYQKLRYLDEDFARINILSGDSENIFDYDYFDEAIAEKDTMFEYFCPSEKCVSVIKISADNRFYSKTQAGGNMLRTYEVENGDNLCILVRDGETLYGLWCEEGITLKEDLIASRLEKPLEIEEDRKYKVREIRSMLHEWISRKTIYNILVGLSEYRTPPIIVVEGGFTQNNPYIVYSTADGWLEDNRPEFAQLAHELNLLTKVGDYILPLDRISGYHDYRDNDGKVIDTENRGRGQNSLTHDAYISREVVKINLVETEAEYPYQFKDHFPDVVDYVDNHPEIAAELLQKMERSYSYKDGYPTVASIKVPCAVYKRKDHYEHNEEYHRKREDKEIKRDYIAQFSIYAHAARKGYVWKETNDPTVKILPREEGRWRTFLPPSAKVLLKLVPEEYAYYVSCKKQFSEKGSTANVRIDSEEFLNLTYIGSETILYYISTKKLGKAFGKNFASNVETLKKALDFVKTRETQTMIVLNRVASKLLDEKDILPKLYKWQKENQVREINDFQAKRFLKKESII